MKKITVIYHSADFDGIFCREIAKRYFQDAAEYVGWNYGDPVPSVPEGNQLYMLDISITALMAWPDLIWIDHHKTAMDEFPATIPGYRIDGVAACRLAQQWFAGGDGVGLPSKQMFIDRLVFEPYAVRLAGEYDIWDKRDPNAEVFQFGLRSMNLDAHWTALLSLPRKASISEIEALIDVGHTNILNPDGTSIEPIVHSLLANGRLLQSYQQAADASLVKHNAFTIDWEGYKFICLNTPHGNSLTYATGLKPEHDACLKFFWNGSKWKFSLYGVPGKPDVDLSVIAVKYGGGGHKQACGFEADEPHPLRKQDMRNIYNGERNAALLSLDEDHIRAFFRKWNGVEMDADLEIFWGGVHKAITGCMHLPLEFRKQSKQWLDMRGLKSLDDGDLTAS